MRTVLALAAFLTLSACSQSPGEPVEMDTPPWGWTDVSGDLPNTFTDLHRTVIADTRDARELYFAVETDSFGTNRAVFVTVYERPSRLSGVLRRLHFGDVPHTGNTGNGERWTRIDPASLSDASPFGPDTDAAFIVQRDDPAETGTSVRRCWDDLCAEVIAAGDTSLSDVDHADLLASLTVRR